MASFMRTAFPSVDEYKAQVNRYDAGRPTTMTDTKIGNRVVPDGGQKFDPSYDAKTMPRAPIAPKPVGGTDRQTQGLADAATSAIATGARKVMDFGTKVTEGGMINRTPLTADAARQQSTMRVTPDSALPESKSLGARNPNQPAQMDANVDPTKNAWAGNYAAADASGQGVFQDPQTNRIAIRLAGEAGNKFMQDQDKAIAEGKGVSTTADEMAARRKAMGEYGGIFKQRDAIPATARPGMTLQATPVEYKRTASSGRAAMGLPAQEEFTPQVAPQRTAIPMTGNPLEDQRTAEAALARRQAEIVEIERNTPGLLQRPGSRDYIDPRLPEERQRELAVANAEQRRQDMRDARDNTIAQTQARDAALAAKGLPTDEARNLAMVPYEERRATINQRNANMAMAQTQETERATTADKVAEREAKEVQDVRKDATDRYVADKNAELATSNAQIGAESKRLDREATMKAALLKLEGVKDPVQLEKLKGYNSAIEAIMSMGQTPTAEQLLEMQKTYGVSDLFKQAEAPAVVKPGYK